MPQFSCSGSDAISISSLRAAYLHSQQPMDHYAVFGHSAQCPDAAHCPACPADPETGAKPLPGSTGAAELPGQNFAVTFGSYIEGGEIIGVETEAATLMHELGHNLGLRHGGADDVNQKPNYISVMNFSYQLSGIIQAQVPGSITPQSCTVDSQCGPRAICTNDLDAILGANVCVRIDYSSMLLPALNEFSPSPGIGGLNESLGVSGGAGNRDVILYFVPGLSQAAGPSSGPIDLNGDGNTTGTHVQADINNDGSFTLLNSFNDWDYLRRTLSQHADPKIRRSTVVNEPPLLRR